MTIHNVGSLPGGAGECRVRNEEVGGRKEGSHLWNERKLLVKKQVDADFIALFLVVPILCTKNTNYIDGNNNNNHQLQPDWQICGSKLNFQPSSRPKQLDITSGSDLRRQILLRLIFLAQLIIELSASTSKKSGKKLWDVNNSISQTYIRPPLWLLQLLISSFDIKSGGWRQFVILLVSMAFLGVSNWFERCFDCTVRFWRSIRCLWFSHSKHQLEVIIKPYCGAI